MAMLFVAEDGRVLTPAVAGVLRPLGMEEEVERMRGLERAHRLTMIAIHLCDFCGRTEEEICLKAATTNLMWGWQVCPKINCQERVKERWLEEMRLSGNFLLKDSLAPSYFERTWNIPKSGGGTREAYLEPFTHFSLSRGTITFAFRWEDSSKMAFFRALIALNPFLAEPLEWLPEPKLPPAYLSLLQTQIQKAREEAAVVEGAKGEET